MQPLPKFTPGSPEKMPETKIETKPESPEKNSENFKVEKPTEQPSEVAASTVMTTPVVIDEPVVMQKKIEKILEEDLGELYQQLNPQDQAKFKALGELTSQKITTLLQQAKVKLSEILMLIKQWLLSITGINKFYAEQEAKIKAAKIIKLRQEK